MVILLAQFIYYKWLDSETGFSGLPSEWENMLKDSGLSKTQILENPETALMAMEYVSGGMQPINKGQRAQKPRLADYLSTDDPNKVFGKLTKLDEGSSGVVYKAIHTKTNMKVIILVCQNLTLVVCHQGDSN